MSDEHCGDCLYQADTNPEEVFCMVDKDWYEKGYKCDNQRKFSNMEIHLRLDMANEVRRRKDAEEAEQRDREFAEKEAEKDRQSAKDLQREKIKFDKKLWRANWWWQLTLVAIGVIGTLIVQTLTN